ncbi:PREDICTED: uncharacterized protein LOC104715589 [Camelina sativa]|uniref:Uncharacterized protein LOC104715589 n=1 Tax=Camelina sativa TaxID=90675 RepID=A0ABM0TTT0_CAMSA|nr:PREDICTED: uncharacterized protein LOC104715589 [Camelina sativa]
MAVTAEAADTTQGLLNINIMNITKLTSTNYMTWSLQVHSLLDGYELVGYVDGSYVPPDQMLTNTDPPTNPAYKMWKRQDKLIYSGLLGTLSPTLQPLVSKTKSSSEIWKTISTTYANPIWGHIQQLRTLTTRFDQLSLLGKPLAHEEQLEFIFGGLPEDFKSVIDQVEGRKTPPSFLEVHEKLINKEAKLMAVAHFNTTTEPTSAHVATTRPGNPGKQFPRQ